MPAVANHTSIGRTLLCNSGTSACVACSSATSSTRAWTRSAPGSWLSRSTPSPSRSAAITVPAPRCTSARTSDPPMPPAAPVTTMVLPSGSMRLGPYPTQAGLERKLNPRAPGACTYALPAGCSGAAEQVCDHFARSLVAARGELLQPLGVLILDADDDCQFGVGIATMGIDVARINRRQVGIEITGLGIRIRPRIVRHVQLLSWARPRCGRLLTIARYERSKLSDSLRKSIRGAGECKEAILPRDRSFEFVAVGHAFHRHADVIARDFSIPAGNQGFLYCCWHRREQVILLPHRSHDLKDLVAEWPNRHGGAEGSDLLSDFRALAAEHL